jgi:lysophospholipase L1-like esterase
VIALKFSHFAVVAAAAATAVASIGAVALSSGASAATATPARATPARATDYYLSLGDSLAAGDQPNSSGTLEPTGHGYTNDLFARLKGAEARKGVSLKLVDLGCADETSTTMIEGGICPYPGAASQLAAAEDFLAAHRGHVALVTVSIGANDIDKCATTTSISTTCVEEGLAALKSNLGTITEGLKKADPCPATKFAGISLYDPFLATWLDGSAGETLATESVTLVEDLNGILQDGYSAAGYKVADVADAFEIASFSPSVSLPGVGDVPLNVALTCKLTFMCAAAPAGPNIHPDDAGYAVIAGALSSVAGIGQK